MSVRRARLLGVYAAAVIATVVAAGCNRPPDASEQQARAQNAALDVLRNDPVWSAPIGRPLNDVLVVGAAGGDVFGRSPGYDAEASRNWAVSGSSPEDATASALRGIRAAGWAPFELVCFEQRVGHLYATKRAGTQELQLIAYVGPLSGAQSGEQVDLQVRVVPLGAVSTTGSNTTPTTAEPSTCPRSLLDELGLP